VLGPTWMHWILQCTWMTYKVSLLSLVYTLVPTMLKDHIFTLQYSLAHYERILSELSPIYLSRLRTDLAITKSGEDKALLYLTSITIAGLCIQSCIGSWLVSKFAIPVFNSIQVYFLSMFIFLTTIKFPAAHTMYSRS
jgi:hypothetical protein